MNIKIEIPKIDDYANVNALAIQVHELHVNWRPDLFNHIETVISRDMFKEMIEKKEVYVAKLDNLIVGYMVICIKEKIYINKMMRDRRIIEVEALCVDKDYRGMGIGTLLLDKAIEIGKDNQCNDICLTVNEENTGAIKLYEKIGMRVKNIAYSMRIDN